MECPANEWYTHNDIMYFTIKIKHCFVIFVCSAPYWPIKAFFRLNYYYKCTFRPNISRFSLLSSLPAIFSPVLNKNYKYISFAHSIVITSNRNTNHIHVLRFFYGLAFKYKLFFICIGTTVITILWLKTFD